MFPDLPTQNKRKKWRESNRMGSRLLYKNGRLYGVSIVMSTMDETRRETGRTEDRGESSDAQAAFRVGTHDEASSVKQSWCSCDSLWCILLTPSESEVSNSEEFDDGLCTSSDEQSGDCGNTIPSLEVL